MSAPIELPMALAGCGLDEAHLAQQLGRYRALGADATVRRPSALELSAQFAAAPDPELLRATIETERACCTFFTLDYAPGDRRLTIAVSDPARSAALDQLQAALSGSVSR